MKVFRLLFAAVLSLGLFFDLAGGLSAASWQAEPGQAGDLSGVSGQTEPGQAGNLSYMQSEGERSAPTEPGFRYLFENPRFYIPWIQLDLSPEGTGAVRFRRGESDDTLDRTVKVEPSTLNRIAELIARSGFLTSGEDYQNKRDFAHLGWMTISVNQGGKQRTVRFNYTQNQEISELAEIFRSISNQAITLFDVDLAIQHQPLDLPKMLDSLENELRLERLAEPDQLIPKLRDIAQDDTLPLIARNQATRLINSIQKGKYKSPVKTSK
jgi:hypothetical protein